VLASAACSGVSRSSKDWSTTSIGNCVSIYPIFATKHPVIDRFENGVATSIKSIDLTATSYQNISVLTNKVMGYVNTLANWQGARWGGVTVQASQIVGRELLLAIPPGATEAQMTTLLQLQQWATTVGVTLNIVVVP
ncbi:MAG: endonuclease toxin domain-containing protein, partial [Anaerolineae bacterium]